MAASTIVAFLLSSIAALATAQNTASTSDNSISTSISTSAALTTVTVPSGVATLPTLTSAATGCPTVTATGVRCSTCVVPACLEISTVTQSCGCPTPVPIQTLNWPCDQGCGGLSCSTSYVLVQQLIGCPTNSANSSSAQPAPTLLPSLSSSLSGALPPTTTSTPNGQVPGTISSGPGAGPTAAAGRAKPFKFWM